ncbi:MFS transporter [Lactobacillus nasalidis]|uniref:MFS transporter n=1 Tax=Lactobacillus nasalidis TaxID=2797258 RepID=A0ABQ3W2M1_9LACO|nr:MFS transporter [Lactobacillus nasalidis]GHV97123.1 MFS transporter [Lactobacillus nasalidis]GHV99970.1 MFS transporter [Lactobacillus nasalidis]GHW00548.1 MFS transporter [Lactobacillus nasalidis]
MSAKKHRYAATATTVYFSYFMMGIGMSLLAQFKPQFAALWHSSISGVLSVVSAVGIGGIVSILITGPISDHFGRRASAVIGHLMWAVYYIGLLYAPNFAVAYVIGIIGGVANSFLNASNFPALMEIFPESASVAGLMSKFAINIGQFCLPLAILLGTALGSGYRTVFMMAGVLYIIMALILAFSPYPDQVSGPKKQEKVKRDFNLGVWCLVLMGFTSTAAFLLWINTYQELAKSYGIAQPSQLQSVYAVGASVAVLFNSFIIKKGVKEIDILIWYPLLSAASLLMVYFFKIPQLLYVTSLMIGFFAASGLYQLGQSVLGQMYPDMKATVQSWGGFFSAFANFAIIQLAASITARAGSAAPRLILLLNVANMLLGVLLAYVVKRVGRKKSSKTN